MEDFNKLEEWIRGWGFDLVCSNKGAEYDPTESVIRYNPAMTLQNQIYDILHECGHHICALSSLKTDSKYKIQRRANKDKRSKRSIRYRVELLREEFEAWENGLDLAKDLGIEVDFDSYQKYAANNIASYCEWISERNWSNNIS